MPRELQFILTALLVIALSSQSVLAQVKLPDTSGRSPNLSQDPLNSSRTKNLPKTPDKSRSKTVSESTPAIDLEPPTIESTVIEPIPEELQIETAALETPAATDTSSPPYSYTLFLDVDYVYKFSGGASSDPMGDNPDAVPSASATVGLLHFYGEYDTAKAGIWKNGTFVLHMIYGAGESPTKTVGDLRSVSNIDASFMSDGKMVMPGLDLLELWYEHAFPLNKSSIRFGVGYLSSDFYKSKYTGLFMNSGVNSIGTEVLWNTMASNPPNTTIGLWYKTKLTENIYGQAVAFDGLPDHSTKVFDVKFDEDEGVFLASEAGWLQGTPKQKGYFKLGIGYWYLSQNIKQNMMVGVKEYPGKPVATRGMYTVIDKAIDDKIGTFFKGGIAVNGINKYRHYFSTGVTYKGILPSRPQDTGGIAIVQSKLSDTYVKYHGRTENGDIGTYTEETIYEVTYSIPVNDWLTIQPDIQYVLQPGMNVMNKNALVGILRAEMTLF